MTRQSRYESLRCPTQCMSKIFALHPREFLGRLSGPLSYHVELLSGKVVRRHMDAIRDRTTLVSRSKPKSVIIEEDDDLDLRSSKPTSHTAPGPFTSSSFHTRPCSTRSFGLVNCCDPEGGECRGGLNTHYTKDSGFSVAAVDIKR